MSNYTLVKLEKLEELPDAKHPGNQPVGKTWWGSLVEEPKVGNYFFVRPIDIRSGLRGVRTSVVTELLPGNRFRTLNSVYQLTPITLGDIPHYAKSTPVEAAV